MLFSYNWLQSFFEKKLQKPEKLADLIIKHAFEVEGIKKIKDDYSLDIGVLANRGSDCFSHIGIAREISAILDYKLQIKKPKLKEDKILKTKDFIRVFVENQGGCPRYTARAISGVSVGPSPKWIREKLEICGLRPINNVVDVTNYVMLETGQPLHAFDRDKLEGNKIIVRFAEKGERIITLDNEDYELNEDILVIADGKKPIALAGIKGGKSPEIDEKTGTIVIESANFNPKNIRFSSKAIDLKTDASWRFEHGIDRNLAEFAINRAAYLIQKTAGGKIARDLIDISSKKKIFLNKIKLESDYVGKLLGFKISGKEIKSILERLGFLVKNISSEKGKEKAFFVTVPSFRLDVFSQEDLIEEVGRIYGYEKINSFFPFASLVPPQKNFEVFWEDMSKDILKEAGFTEIYNYSFISERDAEIFKYGVKEKAKEIIASKMPSMPGGVKPVIELENPISSDFQYMRPSLIPNLLKNIEKNFQYFDPIKIFEFGKIYKNKDGKNTEEKRMLTGIVAGGISKNNNSVSGQVFYQAKGIIDSFLNRLGISNIWYDEYHATPEDSKFSIWNSQKCAEIKIDNEEIGFLGEISDKIIGDAKIAKKLVVFDIDFEKLQKLCSEEHEYRPISKFPAAVRDIAILVPRMVKVDEVLNKIEETGRGFIRDVDLFDIYEGNEIPDQKKNLAFHIIYQAEDRTLSSKEIDDLQNKIINALEKEPEWQVRK